MCVVSAISDYYNQPPWQIQQQPGWLPFPQQPMMPQRDITTIIQSDPEVKEMLKRLIEIADRLDKKLGDVECHDASKQAFLGSLGLGE